ncbi:hypothetical protein [Nocardia cyriacigeorgica]|uniref:hypothetical protein n=1 Tax=Nocardia cyriacigeorgica TaxID=135487 RepID=UPI001896028C|nr:hypothetical protein [Nocardia cyriacigeorgica]MBF6455536.1 hypothetical protein [Nocardia cyriacigeorgica]MBF6479885.1 hypothetical protein [Nocardia cyriacigeorgica]MBF6553722.1 hypothetical protein [Nocardia cyriacigeorgica]
MNLYRPRPAFTLLHSEHDSAENESIAPQRQERPKLPTRRAHDQSMGATLRLWHTRNLDLLERAAAGLRNLDFPAACRNTEPIRGRAHAVHLMADHTKHDCARFRLAALYIEDHL